MKRFHLLAGVALALTSAWAIAQEAPESLLPKSFEAAPAASRPNPAPPASPAASAAGSVRPDTVPAHANSAAGRAGNVEKGSSPYERLTLEQLERMTPEELEEALDIRPTFDIPPSARRSLDRIGIVGEDEGGFPAFLLANQDRSLVRAALAGNNGQLVSRWGHILLRRALASRLDAPDGMNPADFAALRAALLLRMGEGDAARMLVQDIDTGNYTASLADTALDAYAATGDFTGACPAVATQGGNRKEPRWQVARDICSAFRGDGAGAMQRLDRALNQGAMPKIDVLLAQKYAGAAGKARRAVTIEWNDVKDMTPWRYGLAIAVGIEPPASLMKEAGARYAYTAAVAPMLGLARRAEAADLAAGAGILSSAAMVDLYSQLYADGDSTGEWADRAEQLRIAYVGETPAARLAAMQGLWNGAERPDERHSRQVLTAYAAARLPADEAFADSAGPLVASMLTAGLDRNALRWAAFADVGSEPWALLALAAPSRSQPVDADAIDSFASDDNSEDSRKTAFLLAGLAGLGRVSDQTAKAVAEDIGVDLARQTRWTRLIAKAADVRNSALVALLAGVGMQGDGWDRMTPLHLYHIVSALNRVGLGAEARMIAAEAVARG